jgi:hypothetical protein
MRICAGRPAFEAPTAGCFKSIWAIDEPGLYLAIIIQVNSEALVIEIPDDQPPGRIVEIQVGAHDLEAGQGRRGVDTQFAGLRRLAGVTDKVRIGV